MDDIPIDSRKRFEIVRFVVLSGWIATILVSTLVLLASIYISAIEMQDPPEFLKSQANLAFGFLVGSFVGLVKDFISGSKE